MLFFNPQPRDPAEKASKNLNSIVPATPDRRVNRKNGSNTCTARIRNRPARPAVYMDNLLK
jgi:hypothetical protein